MAHFWPLFQFTTVAIFRVELIENLNWTFYDEADYQREYRKWVKSEYIECGGANRAEDTTKLSRVLSFLQTEYTVLIENVAGNRLVG